MDKLFLIGQLQVLFSKPSIIKTCFQIEMVHFRLNMWEILKIFTLIFDWLALDQLSLRKWICQFLMFSETGLAVRFSLQRYSTSPHKNELPLLPIKKSISPLRNKYQSDILWLEALFSSASHIVRKKILKNKYCAFSWPVAWPNG